MTPLHWTPDSLPAWLRRIDPVAWIPVAAMLLTAVLAAVMENSWWALGFTVVAGAIVALEAAVFGPAWYRTVAGLERATAAAASPRQPRPAPAAGERADRVRPTPRPAGAQPGRVGRAEPAPI